MNPEIIRLFGENDSSGHSPPIISQELDTFWKMTQALAESRERLERPFRSAMEKTAALEKELARIRSLLRDSQKAHQETKSQLSALDAELTQQKQAERKLLARITRLEESRAELTEEKEYALRSVQGHISKLKQLSSHLETSRNALALTEKRNRELTAHLAWYQEHWKKVLDRDKQLREIIARLKHELQATIKRSTDSLRTEKEKQAGERQRSSTKTLELEKELELLRKARETERSALEITSNALKTYQTKWDALISSNQQLKKHTEKLQGELDYHKSMLARFGPIEDRTLLTKQLSEQRTEIDKLRRQLLSRANVERELAEAQFQNEQLLQEFTREAARFRELADQDHAVKLELWEKLAKAEHTITELRKLNPGLPEIADSRREEE